jgi:flagellar biosynthesis/type III secretory pathway M-ring protein FliF/YscJ
MEPKWLIVISVIILAILIIVFLILRNQKDKDLLVKKLIDEDEAAVPAERDKDIDSED